MFCICVTIAVKAMARCCVYTLRCVSGQACIRKQQAFLYGQELWRAVDVNSADMSAVGGTTIVGERWIVCVWLKRTGWRGAMWHSGDTEMVLTAVWIRPAVRMSVLLHNGIYTYMYHQVEHSSILPSAHTLYLCVLCGSQNKQRLFPYTAVTDWFL
jgi:hypothetical protein